MKKLLLIYERTGLSLVGGLARAAKEAGVETALVAPSKASIPDRDLFTEIFETDCWDFGALRKIRTTLSNRYDVSGITTIHGLFNGDGLLGATVSELAEEIGLPHQGADALYLSNNKFLMRDALRSKGVPTVDFGLAYSKESALSIAREIGFPVILKPVAGVASNLILKCRNPMELSSNFKLAMDKLPGCFYASVYSFPHAYKDRAGNLRYFDPLRCMQVEKYINGREASVECLVTENNVIPLLVHDKTVITEEGRVVYEDILVTPPVRFSEDEIGRMKEYATQCIKAIGLKNCMSHVELRYDSSGPQLLEVNPRIGGMCVSNSLKTVLGFNSQLAHVQLALGQFEVRDYKPLTHQLHAMYALYPRNGGVLSYFSGLEEVKKLPGMLEAQLKYPIGTKISGDDEECFLMTCWMFANSYEEAQSNYKRTTELVSYGVVR